MCMADAFVPVGKTQYGFPLVEGNVFPFPAATMPRMHTFADIIAPPTIVKKTCVTEIVIFIAKFNICEVAEKFYTNGVIAFVGIGGRVPKREIPNCRGPRMQVEGRRGRLDWQLPFSNSICKRSVCFLGMRRTPNYFGARRRTDSNNRI